MWEAQWRDLLTCNIIKSVRSTENTMISGKTSSHFRWFCQTSSCPLDCLLISSHWCSDHVQLLHVLPQEVPGDQGDVDRVGVETVHGG